MRWLAIILLLSSCGPTAKLRKAEKLIEKAIAQGAKVDSSKYITYDTVKVKAFRDAFKTTVEVNPTFILEKAKELAAAKPESRRPIIMEVQKNICPDIQIDTTYNLKIDSPEGEYKVPIHVLVNSQGGQADLSIEATGIEIPVRTETNKIKISSGYTLWELIILAIAALGVGFAAGRFLKVG